MNEGTPDEDVFPGAKLSDPAMVRAMGGALAVLAGLLEGKGVSTVEKTSNVLGIYAVITGETAPDEGLILACWAGMLRDAAQEKAERDGELGKWE